VAKSAQALGAALVRPIVVHPDKRAALLQLAKVAETLQSRFPQAATALRDRADDRPHLTSIGMLEAVRRLS